MKYAIDRSDAPWFAAMFVFFIIVAAVVLGAVFMKNGIGGVAITIVACGVVYGLWYAITNMLERRL